jgi:hypothetical protein
VKRPALALLIVPAFATLVGQQNVFRARADVVVLDVAVADGRRPVLTLTKDDFEVRDNGVLQALADFDLEKLPLDVTLTIDLSGSMTPAKLASVERAIAQVSAMLRTTDRVAVHSFDSIVRERQPLQTPPAPVRLSTIGPRTALVDALLLSLVTAPLPDRRQLTVFATDGGENASVLDVPTVLDTARFTSSQVSFVIVRDRGHVNDEVIRTVIRPVAQTTGGEVIELDRDDDLSTAFLAAIENFRTSYVLRYSPTGVPAPGWHEVEVKVRNKKYTVRARRGYWADKS